MVIPDAVGCCYTLRLFQDPGTASYTPEGILIEAIHFEDTVCLACATVPVEDVSWGMIKSVYRE